MVFPPPKKTQNNIKHLEFLFLLLQDANVRGLATTSLADKTLL